MVGLWQSDKDSHCCNVMLNLLVPLYVLLIASIMSFPQALALLKVWGNITLMAENLIVSLPTFITLFAIIIMWSKKKVILRMMNFIREDWTKIKSEEEKKVMIKHAKISRMITFGGYFAIGASIVLYSMPVMFGGVLRTLNNLTDTGNRPLLLPSIYFIDVYKTPIYQLIYICQVMTCCITGFCYTTVGTVFAASVLHVCSQLENLAVRMERMLKKERKNFRKNFSSNVQEHQRLIRFVDTVENSFSTTLLMIVPSFMITLCVQEYTLIDLMSSNLKDSFLEVIFSTIYMSYLAFVMFMYSLVGQILENHSGDIQEAIYNCEWYNLKPKEAMMVVMVLVRAQRPLRITAGKFVFLRMNTFASVLKTAAGYLSCLRAVHD